MTISKRTLLASAVLGLAVWPVAHLFLASSYQIDAWEFMGWGMYSQPNHAVHVRIDQLVDGRPMLVRPSDATLRRLDAFADRRARFGRLASVDALGAEILALEPDMDGVVVVVRRWHLDRETARFDFDEERHVFER